MGKNWVERCNAIGAFSKESAEQCQRLINESISREGEVRNAQIQDLAKLQSDGFQSQSNNIQSEQEARQRADQELNGLLTTLINESVSRENDERNKQLQDLMSRWEAGNADLYMKHDEHCNKHQELVALHRDLEASHADLTSKHLVGHQLHNNNYSQLGDQLQAALQEVRNGLQNLATENAADTRSWEERCNAIDAFSKENAEQTERLKQEIPTKLSEFEVSVREQTAKMVTENAKKISIVQGVLNGMQSVIESERMKDRESEEELMRTMQCDRDNVKRLTNEVRTELKRDLAKEIQDRQDALQEQRSEILDKVRGGTRAKKDGQGATENATATPGEAAADGSPFKGSPVKAGGRVAPQIVALEEPEEKKPHSIGSLGHRLSLIKGSTSPKAMTRGNTVAFIPTEEK